MAKHGWAPKWIIVLIHVISEQVSAIKLLKPGNIGMIKRETKGWEGGAEGKGYDGLVCALSTVKQDVIMVWQGD